MPLLWLLNPSRAGCRRSEACVQGVPTLLKTVYQSADVLYLIQTGQLYHSGLDQQIGVVTLPYVETGLHQLTHNIHQVVLTEHVGNLGKERQFLRAYILDPDAQFAEQYQT